MYYVRIQNCIHKDLYDCIDCDKSICNIELLLKLKSSNEIAHIIAASAESELQ